MKLTDEGDLELTLVYVSLYTHRFCRLILTRTEGYLDLMNNIKKVSSSFQTDNDALRRIANCVKTELSLAKMPCHFFNKHGEPIHHIHSLLKYAAIEH